MSEKNAKRRTLNITAVEGETDDLRVAKAALSPELGNAAAVVDWSLQMFPDLSLNECVKLLREEAIRTTGGDLSTMEATLVAQARTLNAIFANLATRAANAQTVPQLESNLRLAFKAQAQSRATIEALHEMKYPKLATFIGQQNIAHQQQVNNANNLRAHAREIANKGNELLEVANGERLDFGTTSAAGGEDSNLETVGKINRSKNIRRKTKD